MTPKIVNFEAVKVAGYLHKTSHKNNTVPAFWQELLADGRHTSLHESAWVADHCDYGVCFDADAEGFSYIVGLGIKSGETVPGDLATIDIPAGEYAVLTATVSKIGETYGALMQWFETNGEYSQADEGIDFELYRCECKDDFVCDACKSGDMQCDIYFKVKRNK